MFYSVSSNQLCSLFLFPEVRMSLVWFHTSGPVTPTDTSKRKTSKERIDELYHPPAPITPMPPYDDMNTPLLKVS